MLRAKQGPLIVPTKHHNRKYNLTYFKCFIYGFCFTLRLLEIDPKAFEASTIAKMRVLFNNYEVDTMVNEHVTANERKEENDFLDAVMSTNVMRQAMLFLQNKG